MRIVRIRVSNWHREALSESFFTPDASVSAVDIRPRRLARRIFEACLAPSVRENLGGDRRRLHDGAAFLARAQIFRAIEFPEHALKLRGYVFELKVFFVKLVIAVFAEPEQTVEFARSAFTFDDEANGVRSADRIVRNAGRQ